LNLAFFPDASSAFLVPHSPYFWVRLARLSSTSSPHEKIPTFKLMIVLSLNFLKNSDPRVSRTDFTQAPSSEKACCATYFFLLNYHSFISDDSSLPASAQKPKLKKTPRLFFILYPLPNCQRTRRSPLISERASSSNF